MIDNKWLPILRQHFKDIPDSQFNEIAGDLLACSTFFYRSTGVSNERFAYLFSNPVYFNHLNGCSSVYLEVGTLSIGYDNLAKRYEALGRTTDVILLDTMANFLIEAIMDDHKPTLKCNFRFGIGYQGTPLSDLHVLIDFLNLSNIIFFTEGGLMQPVKTIAGFRGIYDDTI